MSGVLLVCLLQWRQITNSHMTIVPLFFDWRTYNLVKDFELPRLSGMVPLSWLKESCLQRSHVEDVITLSWCAACHCILVEACVDVSNAVVVKLNLHANRSMCLLFRSLAFTATISARLSLCALDLPLPSPDWSVGCVLDSTVARTIDAERCCLADRQEWCHKVP